MKSTLLVLSLGVAAMAPAQTIPHEFEADRKPTLVTDGTLLIRNGRVLTVTKGFLDGYDILIRNGKIDRIGKDLKVSGDVKVYDASGKFVTPGLVDAHSHRGADDINEGASISAEVRMTDMLNFDQPGIYDALASGITTGLLLHGSANPIGGQSVVVKHKYHGLPSEVIFSRAPQMIKFALGENVKQSGGQDQNPRFPATRQGVEAVFRRAFNDAKDYIREWDKYRKAPSDAKVAPPRRDLRLEALAGILQGRIRVQCHSYRQDEILMMAKLSKEFGFNLTFQHALEAYKVAPELASMGIPVSIFADGFAYKLEVIDSMPMSASILDRAGVLTSINTDTESGTVPLTQDAAKTLRYGTSPDRALRMITINAAIELGVDSQVGSIEVGKDGDLAVWSGYPLSSYTKCDLTVIEGKPYFQRRDAFKVNAKSMAADLPSLRPYDVDLATLKAAKSYLITGATVHPISGPEIPNGSVLIINGKIEAVGRKVVAPKDAVKVDGNGLHVWPGLIDAASQLGMAEIGQVPSATDERENGDFQPDLQVTSAVNPESIHFPKVRYNGVTTAMVLSGGAAVRGQSGIIETLGSTVTGMQINPAFGLTLNIPESLPERFRAFMSPEDFEKRNAGVAKDRKRLEEYFAQAERYCAVPASELAQRDIKLEAFRPYLSGSRPVLFDCAGKDAIVWSLNFAAKHKLKPILVGAAEAWKVADKVKESGASIIATPPAGECPNTTNSEEFDPYDTPYAFPSLLKAAGIPFAFGSFSWEGAMNLPYRVGRTCAFGLSHEDAMRAVTLDAANILGIGDRYGSLDVGKVANVIITDGDPLELTSHLRYLFINGRPVPLESHYTELYRKYMGRVTEK